MQHHWIRYRLFSANEIDIALRLKNHHPELTQTELRICTCISQGLTSNEIAHLYGSSIRNIENHRYRIRKKLQIPQSIPLPNALLSNFN